MSSFFLAAFFPFLMIYAASSDLVSMTIANRVSLALVAGFAAAAYIVGMPFETAASHLGVGGAVLLVTFAMFAAGWVGGGDAKLLAASAIWFGPTVLLANYILLGAVFGGLLTIVLLVSRAHLAPVFGIGFVDRLLMAETGIPYGIALGLSGIVVYAQSPFLDAAVKGLVG